MKKNILYISLVLISISLLLYANADNEKKAVNGALIEFEHDEYDFGEIEEGKVVHHVFKLTNVGNDTLRIKRVDGG